MKHTVQPASLSVSPEHSECQVSVLDPHPSNFSCSVTHSLLLQDILLVVGKCDPPPGYTPSQQFLKPQITVKEKDLYG
jgi:hypothetical protein